MDMASHIVYGEDLRGIEAVEGNDLEKDMGMVAVAGILAEQFL